MLLTASLFYVAVSVQDELPNFVETASFRRFRTILRIPQKSCFCFWIPTKKIPRPVIAKPNDLLQLKRIPILRAEPLIYGSNAVMLFVIFRQHQPYALSRFVTFWKML